MHLVVTKPPYSALKLFVCFAAGRYFEQWIYLPDPRCVLLHHLKQYRSSVRTVYLLHRQLRTGGQPLGLGMYCYSAHAALWLKCLEMPSPQLRSCPSLPTSLLSHSIAQTVMTREVKVVFYWRAEGRSREIRLW